MNQSDHQQNMAKDDDDEQKKMMHREIERQRRQEMTTLCASLRSLLPLEYIKGKRAVSEHMNGAVSYIKDLQKRIEELRVNRDELKKLLDPISFEETSSSSAPPASAVVRPCLDGFEVVVSAGIGVQALRLSRVLELLLEEGLDVISCVSTKVDGGFIHIIQTEVIGDLTILDTSALQQKLNEEI
ncbi:hypothetical protein SLEP1_g17114 [Rubroshorea leprosula]|uniref:BHLH domain-containing protein n=1 Tax=Rubroshorea leprosula TaxID=152421 RepID=A0AAV5IZ22_9ROSI|nr:hypothetical protein SLEP1_g17114 [Rubroshorea leprosula]